PRERPDGKHGYESCDCGTAHGKARMPPHGLPEGHPPWVAPNRPGIFGRHPSLDPRPKARPIGLGRFGNSRLDQGLEANELLDMTQSAAALFHVMFDGPRHGRAKYAVNVRFESRSIPETS